MTTGQFCRLKVVKPSILNYLKSELDYKMTKFSMVLVLVLFMKGKRESLVSINEFIRIQCRRA